MCCKGFIKKVVPFFLTFAVGLFIASFFVSVAAPTFRFNFERRREHRNYDMQREVEIRQLRDENILLKNQLSNNDVQDFSASDLRYRLDVPPPPPIPSAPKTVPYRNK